MAVINNLNIKTYRPKGVSPLGNFVADFWLHIQLLTSRWRVSKGQVGICALFRDEAPYLKEWIEYHRLIGVDHFFLFNNHSGDDWRRVLKRYVEKGIVTLFDLSMPPPFERWQIKAYHHALECSRGKFEWLAAIDVDEFICPTRDQSLVEVLAALDSHPGVFMHWKMFGTSGIEKIGKDELQIEKLQRSSKPEFDDNCLGKCIANVSKVNRFKIHDIVSFDGAPAVLANGSEKISGRDFSVLQLNHYFTRDRNFFHKRKQARRSIFEKRQIGKVRTAAEWDEFDRKLCEDLDTAIQRFVPELKRQLEAQSD